ncbi:hypothetical protein SELMODRAFT_402522 [Selaginella moellendorffii]|uniref:Uncharacterized protein n=1 Tax=Selaginella moellendorffii TaxID=88036 RepID=D8QQX9_SELML|nr:hypothetical protein SELMODRAFT_402522 [Selaginella moellendorffii]
MELQNCGVKLDFGTKTRESKRKWSTYLIAPGWDPEACFWRNPAFRPIMISLLDSVKDEEDEEDNWTDEKLHDYDGVELEDGTTLSPIEILATTCQQFDSSHKYDKCSTQGAGTEIQSQAACIPMPFADIVAHLINVMLGAREVVQLIEEGREEGRDAMAGIDFMDAARQILITHGAAPFVEDANSMASAQKSLRLS